MSAIGNGSNGDRDDKGRFVPGWRGGPGSRLQRRQAKLRKALLQAVDPQAVRAVATTLLDLATEHGDVGAAKLLLSYCIGKPRDLAVTMPELQLDATSLEGIAQALDQVLDAVRGHNIDAEQARVLLQALDSKREALLAQQLEQRVQRLEARA
jgi:hypothetical protein